MRKLSHKRYVWLLHSVQRQSKMLRKMERKRSVRRMSGKAVRKICVLTVPEMLTAEKLEPREKILDIIRQIDQHLANQHRIKLDFSRVKRIYPGGMLILLAALRRQTDRYPRRIRARCPPQSLSAQLLNHFDIASALGVSPHLSRPQHSSVIEWQHLCGTRADGMQVKKLLDQYRTNTEAELPAELFVVLTEGLINVGHHAYPAGCDIEAQHRKWWLFARFTEPVADRVGSIFIAIYDMGVGIPSTLRSKLKTGEMVMNAIDKTTELTGLSEGTWLDKRLLRTAIENPRTQTEQAHRGKGLPEMREFAASTDGGRLHIVSGQAQYSMHGGKPDGQVQGFDEKFPGTLLLWNLPLKVKEQPA